MIIGEIFISLLFSAFFFFCFVVSDVGGIDSSSCIIMSLSDRIRVETAISIEIFSRLEFHSLSFPFFY